MGSALGLVLLDEVLVGVALPTIRDELGLSQVLAQWVVNAYVLALTVCVAAAGRLGDLLGHKPVFLGGGGVLILGSVGAGIADGGELMLASRALQGIGGAAMLALSVAMIGIAFSEAERGAAIGIYGLIAAVPAAAGPFIAGVLTDFASWRLVFLINVPLVITVMAIVAVAWKEPKPDTAHTSFDRAGFAVLLVFLVPLVLALMQAPEWGLGSPPVLALIAVSAVGLALFVRTERRAPDPLIDLELLRPRSVIGSNLVIFAAQFSKIALLVFGAFYLQDGLDISPIGAGAALLAAMVPQLFTAVWSGQLTARYGARTPTLAGVGLMVVSLAWLAAFVGSDSYLLLLPGLLVWGIALPFLFNPAYITILNAVGAEQRGEASGVTSTGRQLGGTLAVAVLGAVLVSTNSYAAVFAISAAVTLAVWIAAFLLIERRAPGVRTAVAASRAG